MRGQVCLQVVLLVELAGAPVGVVTLEERRAAADGGGDGDRDAGETSLYVYRSRHVFSASSAIPPRVEEVTMVLDDASRIHGTTLYPESLKLTRRPEVGCVDVREELGGRTGALCVTETSGAEVRGSLHREPFAAAYDERGELVRLALGAATFRRVAREDPLAAPPDLLLDGFTIRGRGCVLALSPPPPQRPLGRLGLASRAVGGRWALAMASELQERSAPRQTCLWRARALVEQLGAGEVVIGLVAEDTRVYPHAWVRVNTSEGEELWLDPSRPGRPDRGTHLALAADGDNAAGTLLLDLMSGARTVVRRGARACSW